MYSQGPSQLNNTSFSSGGMGGSRVYDYRKGAVLPCTAIQLNTLITSQESGLYGFTDATHMILGLVREVNDSPTSIEFLLDDTTGIVTCSFYGQAEGLELNDYIRAFGKWNIEKKSFQVFQVRPLTSKNEITHHILNVLSVHRKNTNTDEAGGVPVMSETQLENDPELQGVDTQALASIPGSVEVVKFLKRNHTEAGILVDDIAAGIDKSLTVVRPILQQLETMGILYTTTDDDRFAIAS